MVDNEIDVLPCRQALVIEQPRLTHLFGLDEIKEIKKRNSAEISCVNLDTNVAVTSDKKAEGVSLVLPRPTQKFKEKMKAKMQYKKARKLLQTLEGTTEEVFSKMDLRLPSHGIFDEGKKLGFHERVLVGKQLTKVDPPVAHIREMFVATEKQFAEI